MKKQNHQAQVEDTIEKIEQIIERIDPDTATSISDIAGKVGTAKMDGTVKCATIMLLKKYGVKYTL